MKTSRLVSLLPCAAVLFCLSQPAHAGHWVVTYQCSGSDMGTDDRGTPVLVSVDASEDPYWDQAGSVTDTNDTYGNIWPDFYVGWSAANYVITPTLTWTPDNASDTSSPPSTVHYLESSVAYGTVENPDYGQTWAADDGTQDPAQVEGDELISSGKHLLSYDNSGNNTTITLPTRTLNAAGGQGEDYLYEYSSYLSYSVQPDTREVTVTSSIDATYHKDPGTGQPVQNQPDSDGTITADSVQLGDVSGAAITYFANPTGSWASESNYHWYSAATDDAAAGSFTLPNDPPTGFDISYTSATNFGKQEHINLHCQDAGDGAQATANYYVNWHDDIENWLTVVDTKDYGPLTRVTGIYHPLKDSKYTEDFENSVKVDVKATGEGSLGTDKIGAKFGAEIGAEYETSTKLTAEYTWVANKYNWIERQSFWHHREGTVDNYGFHGYMGLLHWTLDSAYNPGSPLVVDFLESQRAEDAGPAY